MTGQPSVLIVDDEPSQAESLRRILALEGFHASTAHSPKEALAEVGMRMPDAIVSDFQMGSMNGLELYRRVREKNPDILFILVTGYGTMATAVEALKAGVHDFIAKPVDTDELTIKLKKALDLRHLAEENQELRKTIARMKDRVHVVAASRSMAEILETVDRVADSQATVLVIGESGTGKELIARSLHEQGPRREGPYVRVNCAAIPENLLESELFGHEEGAFTGAVARRRGRFEIADRGTIFLDEIGELPLHVQPKILRALQEREFERVGGDETLHVDVRVVAATNRDLSAMVREGTFREDLFYRLNVIPIVIPPLRERMDDVLPLARHFLGKYCEKNGRSLGDLNEEACRRLLSYSWPGNVRELENCIERAVVLARGETLSPEDFVFTGDEKESGIAGTFELLMNTDLGLEDLERKLILMTLERCSGNVSKAARSLRLTRRTLQYRIEKIREQDKTKEDSDV
ncbi:MAG TPA: sigma-54-dependent Fis family transcriptional regulator [Planctomycetes bacterium]|nr:sigma-54-dependent Fis family transcriptional regulator [Planctomycetota bacterium]